MGNYLAKIAVPQPRDLARGEDWSISEFVCRLGPQDHPFEERHLTTSITIVAGGIFQYRAHAGCDLMTPGSLMLGTAGQSFECSHEHGTGDRCISFSYSPDFFERLGAEPAFKAQRIPPLRILSPVVSGALASLHGEPAMSWEELAIELAAATMQLDGGRLRDPAPASPGAAARVSRLVREIEGDASREHAIAALAREARLSPYHFLRTFQSVTGVTPHQYVLRMRLRRAAVRLRTEPARIIDIALDSGFGDLSNFNRMFRNEFQLSPRAWRRTGRRLNP